MRTIARLTLDRVVDNVFAEIEQVAFCTQNVVPGIDFSNDPLLQGRNFSYLDTQLKRLGSTNFTQLPVNAPRCPVAHFQRDGHMQMSPQAGRGNYEPNSFTGDDRGPARRRRPAASPAVPREEGGPTRRVRAESFADHYSQARQFWISQTEVEQEHIVAAYAFELGKCEMPAIRTRMLGNLRNVDEDLAQGVADGLGMPLPEANRGGRRAAHRPARVARAEHPANGPDTFAGRKLGVLVADGADGAAGQGARGSVHGGRRHRRVRRPGRRAAEAQGRPEAGPRPRGRRRAVGAVRRGGGRALRRRGAAARRRARRPATSSTTRSPTRSSSGGRPTRRRSSTRRG